MVRREDDTDNPSEPSLLSKEMLMEANEAIEELHTFCHVRNILKHYGKDNFVISWMREQLCANYKVIGKSTLRNHLYAVRELFEPHFHPAEDGRNQKASHLPPDNMRAKRARASRPPKPGDIFEAAKGIGRGIRLLCRTGRMHGRSLGRFWTPRCQMTLVTTR